MDQIDRMETMKYYKSLKLKVQIEENRLEIYRKESSSIEATLEPDRAMMLRVQIQNQMQFLGELKKSEKTFTEIIYGYARTLDDYEATVLSMCIMKNRPCKECAVLTNRSLSTVKNTKSLLNKELNTLVVKEPV